MFVPLAFLLTFNWDKAYGYPPTAGFSYDTKDPNETAPDWKLKGEIGFEILVGLSHITLLVQATFFKIRQI